LTAYEESWIASDTFRGVYLIPRRGEPQLLLDQQTLPLASWADIALGQEASLLAIPDLFGTQVAFCHLR
jgi:hypothetical protein